MTLKSNNPNLDCFKNPDISLSRVHRLSRVLSFSAQRKHSVSVCTNTAFSSQASHWLVAGTHRMLLALIGRIAVLQLSTYVNLSDSLFFSLACGSLQGNRRQQVLFSLGKVKTTKEFQSISKYESHWSVNYCFSRKEMIVYLGAFCFF